MSGPKCSSYTYDDDYWEKQARREQEEQERRWRLLQEAVDRVNAVEQRLNRIRGALASARATYPEAEFNINISPPERPTEQTDALNVYASRMENLLLSLESQLKIATDRATANSGLREALRGLGEMANAAPKTAAEVLEAYTQQAKSLKPTAKTDDIEKRKQEALHILGRLVGVASADIPHDMEALMRDMLSATDPIRAESLGLQLCLNVQQFNKDVARKHREREEAKKLLRTFPKEITDKEIAVRRQVEAVILGSASLTNEVRKAAEELITAAKTRREQKIREQSAKIVKESLEDLGYEVEGIGGTLFVEGGLAHIHREEWGDQYYVRLRVMPNEQYLSFNMVRVQESGGNEEVYRKNDAAMETSWCSGHQRLMDALRTRGIDNRLERHAEAGEIPMQTVSSATVPAALRDKYKKQRPADKFAQPRQSTRQRT